MISFGTHCCKADSKDIGIKITVEPDVLVNYDEDAVVKAAIIKGRTDAATKKLGPMVEKLFDDSYRQLRCGHSYDYRQGYNRAIKDLVAYIVKQEI